MVAGPNAAQPPPGELGLGRVDLPVREAAGKPRLEAAPSGTGCSSTSPAGGRGRSAAPPRAGRAPGSSRAARRPTDPGRSRAPCRGPGPPARARRPRPLRARRATARTRARSRRSTPRPSSMPEFAEQPLQPLRARVPRSLGARRLHDARDLQARSTHIVRRIACMRTSVRSSYSAASTAAIDGSLIRASADRNTVVGSLEWSPTRSSATRDRASRPRRQARGDGGPEPSAPFVVADPRRIPAIYHSSSDPPRLSLSSRRCS